MIDDAPTDLADSPPVDAGAGGIWLNYRIVADAIGAAIVGARPACVRLDLDRVSFIDARGVAALVDCAELATASGAHFVIPCASQQVRAVLDACRLSDLLSVRDDARPAS
jgi:anti-anti-sigma factor